MTLMGVFATLVMDLLAILFSKLSIIHPFVKPEAVGRWILYMLKGKFLHQDINKTQALNNEKLVALLSHYLIGVFLAGIYLIIEIFVPVIRHQFYMPVVFGIATVILPWFWLFPSFGLGFMASKAPKRSLYITTSLINHTDFGLGFLIWIILFRSLLF